MKTEKQILKNVIVGFRLKDSNNLKFAKIISRSGTATGKYKKWKLKLGNNSIKQIEFDRDMPSFENAPHPL